MVLGWLLDRSGTRQLDRMRRVCGGVCLLEKETTHTTRRLLDSAMPVRIYGRDDRGPVVDTRVPPATNAREYLFRLVQEWKEGLGKKDRGHVEVSWVHKTPDLATHTVYAAGSGRGAGAGDKGRWQTADGSHGERRTREYQSIVGQSDTEGAVQGSSSHQLCARKKGSCKRHVPMPSIIAGG